MTFRHKRKRGVISPRDRGIVKPSIMSLKKFRMVNFVRKLLSIAALVLVIAVGVVGVSGCGSSGSSSEENKPTIIVSSKPPTEAMLLGTMTYMYLEELGYPVENQMALGSLAVIRPALEAGEINCYWEYTGTVLINIMENPVSWQIAICSSVAILLFFKICSRTARPVSDSSVSSPFFSAAITSEPIS
jgi:hypothetical protein